MTSDLLAEHTAVEVTGVDLTAPVSEGLRSELIDAFHRHLVLVIRDQNLDPQQMLGAVQLFGEVFTQHNKRFSLTDCPQIHYLSNEDHYSDGNRYIPGAGYHTDHSNAPEPPKATVLLARSLPETGGDTQFVNMYSAYADLPDEIKLKISNLKAVHVYQSHHSARKLMPLSEESQKNVLDGVVHPLARTHPETARKVLYINPIRIEAIEGLSEPEALTLLDELLPHATQEKYQYRHKWRLGDLVMWDNRCLLHKANDDYDMTQLRYLYRVMLKGDKPV
jgi:taurine dioxygenase